MSTAGLEGIEHTVQITHAWINELYELLGWESKSRSYRLLRTVLQAVRDWLTVYEAAAFGAHFQLCFAAYITSIGTRRARR
jgi:uncharacterized protein (DUF2267 family)